jgi:DNA-nicking Smr family endonuclease
MPSPADSADPIFRHLERFGVVDKDAADRPKPAGRGRRNALQPRKGGRRMALDLHGMPSDEAVRAVAAAIDDCADGGVGQLLIIHGQGLHSLPSEGPVLKNAVLRFLEGKIDRRIRSFTAALPRDGGDGATLVRFK